MVLICVETLQIKNWRKLHAWSLTCFQLCSNTFVTCTVTLYFVFECVCLCMCCVYILFNNRISNYARFLCLKTTICKCSRHVVFLIKWVLSVNMFTVVCLLLLFFSDTFVGGHWCVVGCV